MNRRHFTRIATLAAGSSLLHCNSPGVEGPLIMTVNGLIPASELGRALSHEHIMVDFVEAALISPDRYNPTEVFNTVLPYLREIRQLGCASFFDFTPDYLGRDPRILKRLSDASGLHIVTNTGYYGARNDVHLPPHAMEATVDELAAGWTREFEEGIAGAGIRPGFLKIGVDSGSLSNIDARLVRAAARAHLATGLTIAVHTGPAEGAFEQLDILREEGVAPSAWIWVHAQVEADLSRHVAAAEQGAWVAFDGVNEPYLERHLEAVRNMKDNDLLGHVLISQDAGWYSVGEEGGGSFRGYSMLFETFLPALQDAGFTTEEIDLLMVVNPARAFSLGVRANT